MRYMPRACKALDRASRSAAVPNLESISYLARPVNNCGKVHFQDIHILLPISMVGFAVASVLGELFCNRSNPDSSESHSLDIVQLATISVMDIRWSQGCIRD